MAILYLVSTPIGNLADLSPRAAEALSGADRILAEDTRRSRILTDHVGARAPLVSLHAHNEAERTEEVLAWLAEGETLALVTDAGTPLVSDPGGRLVASVADAGHRVIPIPGPSAVLAALVASGLPTDRFSFLGFPPRKGKDRSLFMGRVALSPETTILFESPQRLTGLLEDMTRACGEGRRVCVARELTKVHEELVRGTLSEATGYYREHPPRGEVTLVVGPAEEDPEDDEARWADARALARELLAEGRSASRTAKEVARRLDLPRNAVYRIVHEVDET